MESSKKTKSESRDSIPSGLAAADAVNQMTASGVLWQEHSLSQPLLLPPTMQPFIVPSPSLASLLPVAAQLQSNDAQQQFLWYKALQRLNGTNNNVAAASLWPALTLPHLQQHNLQQDATHGLTQQQHAQQDSSCACSSGSSSSQWSAAQCLHRFWQGLAQSQTKS
jgi:hypothetical protein